MIKTKSEFERIIAIGYALQGEHPALPEPITLAEVILLKQYAGCYFMTLAVRKAHTNDELSLVVQEGEL